MPLKTTLARHPLLLGFLMNGVACAPAPDNGVGVGSGTGGGVDAALVDAGRTDASDADAGDPDDAGDMDGAGDPCLPQDDGSSSGDGLYEADSFELLPGDEGITVHYPASIADSACTFSVVGWGNGTSSSGGDAYPAYFERLARHGFVVAVAHTNFAANGPVILDAVARVLALNGDTESVFFGKLRTEYGVMGKSQGAIAAARDVNADPNAVAAVMVAGSRGTVTRPALFASGTDDFLQRMTLAGFEDATDEAVYAEAMGLDHLELDESVAVAQLATSFLRCHLRGDAAACAYVACEDCQVEPWATYRVR